MSNSVTQEQIDNIFNKGTKIAETVGNKTTVVHFEAPNGFIIVESSSCVDPISYDFKTGKELCFKKIKDKLWELEGYKLQDKLNNA